MVAFLVVGVMGLVGLALIRGSGDSFGAKGILALLDSDVRGPSIEGDFDACKGSGGYQDVSSGLGVTVRNDDGKIVGSGTFRNVKSEDELMEYLVGAGQVKAGKDAEWMLDFIKDVGVMCVLVTNFEMTKANFYEFGIGRRGTISMSHDDFVADDYYFSFTLGD